MNVKFAKRNRACAGWRQFLVLASFAMFVGWGLGCEAAPRGENGFRQIATDICIYGGTSGGVVAAIQSARMGRSVVLVEPGRYLGGMTAGGLSWTDVGSSERMWIIGGLAKEFYSRVGKHYGQSAGTVFDPPT